MLSDAKRQVINLWNCCIWLVNLFEIWEIVHLVYCYYKNLLLPVGPVATAVAAMHKYCGRVFRWDSTPRIILIIKVNFNYSYEKQTDFNTNSKCQI